MEEQSNRFKGETSWSRFNPLYMPTKYGETSNTSIDKEFKDQLQVDKDEPSSVYLFPCMQLEYEAFKFHEDHEGEELLGPKCIENYVDIDAHVK